MTMKIMKVLPPVLQSAFLGKVFNNYYEWLCILKATAYPYQKIMRNITNIRNKISI